MNSQALGCLPAQGASDLLSRGGGCQALSSCALESSGTYSHEYITSGICQSATSHHITGHSSTQGLLMCQARSIRQTGMNLQSPCPTPSLNDSGMRVPRRHHQAHAEVQQTLRSCGWCRSQLQWARFRSEFPHRGKAQDPATVSHRDVFTDTLWQATAVRPCLKVTFVSLVAACRRCSTGDRA